MADMVSSEKNRDLWLKLRRQWEVEKRPGYVIMGKETYRVNLSKGEEEVMFERVDDKDFYGSRSF